MKQDAARWKALTEEYVSAEERAAYFHRAPGRVLWTFLHVWAGLALAFLAIWWTYRTSLALHLALAPVIIVFIGTRINAFAVQVHEGSHGSLFANRRLNDMFCNLAGSYWALNDVASYWRMHRDHHAFLHEDTDPDLSLYLLPSRDPRAILLLLLQDFLWITAARRIHQYLFGARNTTAEAPPKSPVHTLGKLATLVALLTLFTATFGLVPGAVMFIAYWMIPLFSVFPVLIRIRIVAEHYSDLIHEDIPRLFVSRTSVSNRLEEYFIGAQMEYHLEHHLFPKMPYHQLKRYHRLLWKRGFFASPDVQTDQAISGGYLHYWKMLLTRADTPNPAAAPTV